MMKKFALLLPGVVALGLSLAPLMPALAQSATTTPTSQQQHRVRKNPLNLTDDQKAQIKKLHEETRAKIEGVLTADQKAQLEAWKQQRKAEWQARKQAGQSQQPGGQPGQRLHKAQNWMKALNLSDDQKAQIRAIRQDERKQMESILTPDQLAQLKARQQQWRSHHKQHQQQQQQPAQPSN